MRVLDGLIAPPPSLVKSCERQSARSRDGMKPVTVSPGDGAITADCGGRVRGVRSTVVDNAPRAGTSATAVRRPNQKISHAAQSRSCHTICKGAVVSAGLPHGSGKSTSIPCRSERITTSILSATLTSMTTGAVPFAGRVSDTSCHDSRSVTETSVSICAARIVSGVAASSGPITTATRRPNSFAVKSCVSKPVSVR